MSEIMDGLARERRRGKRITSVCGVVAALVLLAGTTGVSMAAAVPSGSTPLLPSNFQGGDGNQDDQAPLVDWEALQAQPGRVAHNPDTTPAPNSQFSSGKEQSPGDWVLETEPASGANPAKNNILDGWSSVDQVGGQTFLYLGFTRDPGGSTGTTTVVFELNQDARTWNNGGSVIPCRRNGDLLVVFNAHGNDPNVDVNLQRWRTDPGGTDPVSGCDRHGTLVNAQSVPANSIQGSTNPGPIAVHLPGSLGTITQPRLFGEAALNLTKLFSAGFNDACFSFGSISIHTRASDSDTASLTDFIAPRPLVVRRCAAAGTKFLDLNADGVRDAGDPGLPRFLIWADYNNDGIRQANEPFTETDAHGNYVLNDIRPPTPPGTYRLREALVQSEPATSWTCSFPTTGTTLDGIAGFGNGVGGLFHCGWGPIDPAARPFPQGLDFGNWLPAHLTLKKQLAPPNDPGRFTILVNGEPQLVNVGNGATITIPLEPGSYDITEEPVPPTDAADYDSTVNCTASTARRGRRDSGPAFNGLVLRAGGQGSCTFVNVRRGAPAIAVEKTGPVRATAGDTLHYTLAVTNPGSLPLTDVHVTDPTCDEPPKLESKADASGPDNTPGTLDPGDTWTYTCSRKTHAPSGDCVVSVVTNAASVSGKAPDGSPVTADATISTTLECPDVPPVPPLPPEPTPTPTPLPPRPTPHPPPRPSIPSPPAGSRVPPAGQAGRAGLRLRHGCISRLSHVRLVGTRIHRFRVRVDGRPVRLATLRILQRRATVLRRVIRPGRHRLAVRVTFQRGSGTPAVTLKKTVRVCGRGAQANFTG